MVERYRIVIDIRTDKPLAYQIFQKGEDALYYGTKRGRVALYRVHHITLDKDVVEKTELIEARTH